MRPLKDTAEWPPIAVYDLEMKFTWVDVQLVCHVDELGNRVHFPTVKEYVDWLFSPKFKGSHVWAHYGGKFDHRFLIPEFNRRGWDFRAALSGGAIVHLTVTGNGKKIYFADSFRLMPNRLKDIGLAVDLEKLDVDRSNMAAVPFAQTLEYCYRDCDIVLKGLQLMKAALTSVGADFAFTLASIASRWVRRSPSIDFNRFYRAQKGTLIYDPQMLESDKFSKPAYAGGRVEMFKTGLFRSEDSVSQTLPFHAEPLTSVTKKLYYYDVISSYPASMREDLPLYFKGFYPPPKSDDITQTKRYLSYCGITEATVYIPKQQACPLFYSRAFERELGRRRVPRCKTCLKFAKCECAKPNREKTKFGHRLTFPYGMFRGRWANIELMEALNHGAVIICHGQARFEAVPFLRNFVDTFYGLRKRAKKDKEVFRSYVYKILLNSLYGKLVETVDRCSYVTSRTDLERAKKDRAKGTRIESTKIPGVYCIKSQEEGPFLHVAAGAYVTAYSRIRLLAGIKAVHAKGGNVYYCDTDSIITDIPMPELEGEELGQWKHEHTFQELEVLLPKVYRAVMHPESPCREQDTYKVHTHEEDFLYRCKGLPIVREGEEPTIPQLRWEAFKRYAETGDPEMAMLLQKNGLSGFVQDMKVGSIKPREMPMLRCLQSLDKKRDWYGQDSEPLYVEDVAE